LPKAQASVVVNSLGLLDIVQVEATGLTPEFPIYQVYLAGRPSVLGRLEFLAVLKTKPVDRWKDSDEKIIESCSILTTEANALSKDITTGCR
jgi:hypothetical protein